MKRDDTMQLTVHAAGKIWNSSVKNDIKPCVADCELSINTRLLIDLFLLNCQISSPI